MAKLTEEQKIEMCKRIMKAMGGHDCPHEWVHAKSPGKYRCKNCGIIKFGRNYDKPDDNIIRYDENDDAFDKLWKYIVEHVSCIEQRYQKIHDDGMPKYWCLMRVGGGVFAIGKSGEDMKLAVLIAFDKWLVEREGEVCKNDN